MILNDLDSAGRGKKETRRKEGRVGRRYEESEIMKKLLKEMKNGKVAKGRIIGLSLKTVHLSKHVDITTRWGTPFVCVSLRIFENNQT